jgi:hypothetical protein
MGQELLVDIGKYVREKRNFIKVGTASVGVLSAIGLLWMFGTYGGAGWWLFLIVLALLGGWAWAHLMWLAVGNEFRKISSDSTAPKVNEDTRE